MIAEHLLVVDCPTCGAEAGEMCHSYTGRRSTCVHVERQRLVHLDSPDYEPPLDPNDDRRLIDRAALERGIDFE